MKDTCFLVFNEDGFVRATKRWPSLGREEIAVQVKATIPDSSFRSPVLAVSMDVKDQQVIQPTVEMEALEAPQEPSQ